MWAGWYDIFAGPMLNDFDALYSLSGGSRRGGGGGGENSSFIAPYLAVDPIGHCADAAYLWPDNLIKGRSTLPIVLALDMMLGYDWGAAPGGMLPAWPGVKHISFYVMGSPASEEDRSPPPPPHAQAPPAPADSGSGPGFSPSPAAAAAHGRQSIATTVNDDDTITTGTAEKNPGNYTAATTTGTALQVALLLSS